MKTKIITGVILALAAALFLWLDWAILWVLLACLAAFVGYFEAYKLYELAAANSAAQAANSAAANSAAQTTNFAKTANFPKNGESLKAFGAIMVLAACVIFLAISPASPLQIALFCAVCVCAVCAWRACSFASAFAVTYALVGVFCLLEVYLFKGTGVFLWLIICVCACDSAAYFVGKAIGRTPFSASSPNKTAEGVAGGLIAAVALGGAWGILALEIPAASALAFSLIFALMGVAGDLFESRLKRLAGVKDSGAFLPGHGGVLDRLDALIFAGFIAEIAL